jgi:hypothetical protein
MDKINEQIYRIGDSEVTALVQSYNVLHYANDLRRILSSVIPEKDFSTFTKFELHNFINQILVKKFKGENGLKAKLVEMFIEKKVTAAFEIKVNNSRVDFLKVNGDTVSYEIKSKIDSLIKLTKQVGDYEKVFEYNYIVIDEIHLQQASDLIPKHYGIYVLEKEKLVRKKVAIMNCNIEPLSQLKLFTKKELEQHYKNVEPMIMKIEKQFSSMEINESFKTMLKKRYEKRWEFLRQNINDILPIDYQFFFQHNISPKVIYET